MTPNNFFILTVICRRKFYKIFYHPTKTLNVTFLSLFSFFKYRFCCGMLKERNFVHVIDLSFDARILKYYSFSLHYHKHCPINYIQIKCSQIGQNVFDIFRTCSLQIVADKLRWLLALACNFIKKESLAQVFSCAFSKISQNTSGPVLQHRPLSRIYKT